jgi:hypothetical protein
VSTVRVIGHLVVHRLPLSVDGVGSGPRGDERRFVTLGGRMDASHADDLGCWCRPLVVAVYDEMLP